MTENTITLDTEDMTANRLVATIRAAVNGASKYAEFVEAHPNCTRETVADYARALAVLTYPNDKPVQKTDGKRTRFGNAVQAAGKGLRAVFEKTEEDDTPKPVVLRVSLSGEGGGSTTVPADHPLYKDIVALIGANES